MKAAAAFAILALLAACEQVATEAVEYRPAEAGTVDHAMCLLGFTGVPLRELMTGHHLVEVTLNGRKATFVLDTGANRSVLHAPYAKELGIGEGMAVPAAAIGLGGTMKARLVEVERIEIAGMPIRESRMMSADLSPLTRLLGPMSGGRVYGLVGQDVMKEHRAVIDVARPILYLMAADEDPAPVASERCSKKQEREAKAP